MEQAFVWLIRVQSDRAAPADWSALAAWFEQSPNHLAAFDRAERLSVEIDGVADEIAARLEAKPAVVVPLRPAARRRPPPWRAAAAAAASVAAVAIAAPGLWSDYHGRPAIYRTGPGQTRALTLADGSRIVLDSASTITVRLGMRERRVDFGEGEATFEVAKDARRPFLIDVGDQQVRVVGTEFNISHYDKQEVVSVRRGVVEVRQPDLGGEQPVATLTKGDELRHADGAKGSFIAMVNPNAAFAWTQGRLICYQRPAGEIVAYLNRRYATPIRISDSAAKRPFSGVLVLGDEDDLVRHLADYLSLSVDRKSGAFVLG